MLKDGVDGIHGNCLHGDDTSKYSRHYQNFQVTTQSGESLSFGLLEVADSDANTVLKFLSVISLLDIVKKNCMNLLYQ